MSMSSTVQKKKAGSLLLDSGKGFMNIQVLSLVTGGSISFSWTTDCDAGYTEVSKKCVADKKVVVCDSGTVINSATQACTPCGQGTFSANGWVNLFFDEKNGLKLPFSVASACYSKTKHGGSGC